MSRRYSWKLIRMLLYDVFSSTRAITFNGTIYSLMMLDPGRNRAILYGDSLANDSLATKHTNLIGFDTKIDTKLRLKLIFLHFLY